MKNITLGLGLLLSLTTTAMANTWTTCLESFGDDGISNQNFIAAEMTSNPETGLTESIESGINFTHSKYCTKSLETGYGLEDQTDDSPVRESLGCYKYGELEVYLLAKQSMSTDTGLIVALDVVGEFSGLEYCLNNL